MLRFGYLKQKSSEEKETNYSRKSWDFFQRAALHLLPSGLVSIRRFCEGSLVLKSPWERLPLECVPLPPSVVKDERRARDNVGTKAAVGEDNGKMKGLRKKQKQ